MTHESQRWRACRLHIGMIDGWAGVSVAAIEKRRPFCKPPKAEGTGGHAILGIAHELLSQQELRGTLSGGNSGSVRSRLSTEHSEHSERPLRRRIPGRSSPTC